jgi:Peptidase family M28
MRTRIARNGRAVLLLVLAADLARAGAPEPQERRLREEVATLASPAFEGRRGEGGRKAASYLVEAFRALELEPLFDREYTQPVPGTGPGQVLGRNVGARLVGSDPILRDEWIVVSAHFDHLGIMEGVLYPGADDNASGVAMMLEVARSLVQGAERPKRSVMLVGFDLEEIGLYGSRYFVEHPPVPIEKIALFITADMIGRSLGGVCDPYVFVMGTEHAPGLRPWIAESARGRPVTVGLLGTDLMLIARSDYGPFRARKVPYLFFTTGENPRYHSPRDTAETLDYAKLEAISRVILGVVRRASGDGSVPKWNPAPDNPLAEAVTIRDVLKTLLKHRETFEINGPKALMMTNALRQLDQIVARGTITPAERAGMVTMARFVILSVL